MTAADPAAQALNIQYRSIGTNADISFLTNTTYYSLITTYQTTNPTYDTNGVLMPNPLLAPIRTPPTSRNQHDRLWWQPDIVNPDDADPGAWLYNDGNYLGYWKVTVPPQSGFGDPDSLRCDGEWVRVYKWEPSPIADWVQFTEP